MAEVLFLTAMAIVILLIILVLLVIAAYHKLLKLQQIAMNHQMKLGERIQFAWNVIVERNEELESNIVLSKKSSLEEIEAQYELFLRHNHVIQSVSEKDELLNEHEIQNLIIEYNQATETYNHSVKKFPLNMIAALFQLRPRHFFDVK